MTKKKEVVEWKGAEELRPFLRPVSQLRLDPRNARRHSDRNIMVVKSSFREWGQDQFVIVGADGIVQIGNARLVAARELGWTHVAAIDPKYTGVSARLRAIVDNRSGDPDVGSTWDFPNLADDLADLDCGVFDLDDFGFDEDEREQIATWDKGDAPGGGEGGEGGEREAGPRVVVFCDSKEDQELIFEKMTAEGFRCRKKG